MSAPRYRGPIETVEQAMWAGMVLHLTCERCRRPTAEWAYHLYQRRRAVTALPLNRTIGGFFCQGCMRTV